MLRFTTAGESHGPAILATVEGLPRGFSFPKEAINAELMRRQGGYGRGGRMRIERDEVEVLAGVNRNILTGAPLVMIIRNRDARLDKAPRVTRARPGHVDLAAALKYGEVDARDFIERASARETAARVMIGALCSSYLQSFDIHAFAYVRSIGDIVANKVALEPQDMQALAATRNASAFYTIDNSRDGEMKAAVDRAKADGDTLGGVAEIVIFGLPPGLGRHTQWDLRLDGNIARASMSIQSVKGVEIGMGFEAARCRGRGKHF